MIRLLGDDLCLMGTIMLLGDVSGVPSSLTLLESIFIFVCSLSLLNITSYFGSFLFFSRYFPKFQIIVGSIQSLPVISGHSQIFQVISGHFQSFSSLPVTSGHYRLCLIISGHFRSLEDVSSHFWYFPVIRVRK